jgi:hypothetical protein
MSSVQQPRRRPPLPFDHGRLDNRQHESHLSLQRDGPATFLKDYAVTLLLHRQQCLGDTFDLSIR